MFKQSDILEELYEAMRMLNKWKIKNFLFVLYVVVVVNKLTQFLCIIVSLKYEATLNTFSPLNRQYNWNCTGEFPLFLSQTLTISWMLFTKIRQDVYDISTSTWAADIQVCVSVCGVTCSKISSLLADPQVWRCWPKPCPPVLSRLYKHTNN